LDHGIVVGALGVTLIDVLVSLLAGDSLADNRLRESP
jgi:hypothetical protein